MLSLDFPTKDMKPPRQNSFPQVRILWDKSNFEFECGPLIPSLELQNWIYSCQNRSSGPDCESSWRNSNLIWELKFWIRIRTVRSDSRNTLVWSGTYGYALIFVQSRSDGLNSNSNFEVEETPPTHPLIHWHTPQTTTSVSYLSSTISPVIIIAWHFQNHR